VVALAVAVVAVPVVPEQVLLLWVAVLLVAVG
jgi:hypothetical protein